MSKAFTREDTGNDDSAGEEEKDAFVPGGKNYMTPGCAEKLRQELKHLKHTERPQVCKTVQWAAENGDRSENADYTYGKKRLREIDRRLRFLAKRIESAEIVDPLTIKAEHILFGATVSIRYEDDTEKTYSIVGVDEVDVSKGKISWMSPLAKALHKANPGDVVNFSSPKGMQEIEVISVEYKEID